MKGRTEENLFSCSRILLTRSRRLNIPVYVEETTGQLILRIRRELTDPDITIRSILVYLCVSVLTFVSKCIVSELSGFMVRLE